MTSPAPLPCLSLYLEFLDSFVLRVELRPKQGPSSMVLYTNINPYRLSSGLGFQDLAWMNVAG